MRGQGRVYQRGGMQWVAYCLNGKEYRESARTSEPKEAEKFLREKMKEVGADQIGARKFTTPQAHRLTVAQLCQAVKANYELHGKASPQNLCHLARAEKDFGQHRATALSAAVIDRYIKSRLDDGDRPATINRTTGMLLQAFQHAVANEQLTRVPRITHLSEKGNARKGFLAPAQFEKLLTHIPANLKDFVEWGYKTGQRKGETGLMTWAMLDGDVLRLPGDIAKNREARTLPLTAELAEIIKRRQAARRVEVNGTSQLCEFIFHRGGQPVGDFKKRWKTACKKAGVPGTLYHDLRRSFVKNGTRAGIRASLLMRAGGWATESMLKRYQIEIDEEVRAAMEQTEKYVTAEKAKAQAQAETNVVAIGGK